MKRLFLLLVAVTFSLASATAQKSSAIVASQDNAAASSEVAKKDHFLPTSRRVDRNIDRNKFVYKGEATLILPAIQVNIRAGNLPPAENNGVRYLRIPLNVLR